MTPDSAARGLWLQRSITALVTLACLVGYTLLVTYDVRVGWLGPSVWRYLVLPVEPAVVAQLPESPPAEIEALEPWVEAMLPWARDADVWGVPWYFPTPSEALAAGRGDCEAQAVVLASILAARGVPFTLRASFSHVWLDYPGKPRQFGETVAEAWLQRDDGRWRMHWPSIARLREHYLAQKDLLWTPLAPLRKILLLLGWPILTIGVPWWRTRRLVITEPPSSDESGWRSATHG